MSLTLKIKVLGNTKTLTFKLDSSVYECCKEIKEKFENSGGADYGLFCPDQGKWLISSKVIDFYDLKNGDLLEYKKKHRNLKFRTLDGSIKTVVVDETLHVQQLVDIVCARIGITNTEEYSFQPEVSDVTNQKGGKDVKKNKKQHVAEQIAEDARWLNPDKTLAEQGLGEADIVILKKKFYFTDQNIDRNDPVQLNLLYNQAKDSILSGKHPCTSEEASQFAAIQCQIQFGNHEPDKHKIGFIKVKDYIPPEYQKNKEVEKKIYQEHRKLQGLSELNAKFRYVQLSRSLKTYGITFFLVKERIAKKNKLVVALLGVTKSSVVKLDMETKDILKEWKLTQLRRWAASPNSFTLDFGDYSEAYYSVQTTEGEQISQLIAGYIDIILKKRKEAEKVYIEEEEEKTSVEEYIKPSRATDIAGVVSNGHRVATEIKPQLSHPNGIFQNNGGSMGQFGNNSFMFEQQPAYVALQQAHLMAIKNGFTMLKASALDLNTGISLPPIGDDPASIAWREQTIDVNSSNVASQLASLLAAAGSLINHATGISDQMEYETLNSNIAGLTTNISQISPAIKLMAALSEDGDGLLDSALALIKAINNLLEAARLVGSGDAGKRNEMHQASRDLSSEVNNILSKMGRCEVSADDKNDLMSLANSVVKAVGDMVSNARGVSKTLTEPQLQSNLVSDAKYVFDCSHNLNAAVITVCPTVNVQVCTDQILEGSVLLRDAIGMLINSCSASQNSMAVDDLMDAAHRVEESIARLVAEAANAGKPKGSESSEIEEYYDLVVSAADNMLESAAEMEAIIRNTKALTLSSTQFVQVLKKTAASETEEDERIRLMAAAKSLAEATQKMVASAKEAARAVLDTEKQELLKFNVLGLKKASTSVIGSKLKGRAFYKLSKAIKDVLSSSKQLISASKGSAPSNRNQASQLQLNLSARKVNETLPAIISSLKSYSNKPDDLISQTKLTASAKQALNPGYLCITTAKASGPSIGDVVAQSQLLSTAKQHEDALNYLEKMVKLVEELNADGQIDNAIKSIQSIQKELTVVQLPSTAIDFQPLNTEDAQLELYSVANSIQNTITLIAETAAKGNERQTGIVVTDAVLALQSLSMAVQGFAATEEDVDLKDMLFNATSSVGDTLCALISAAKQLGDTGTSENIDFSALASNASKAMESVVECLPGQKEMEAAITAVSTIVEDLFSNSKNFSSVKKTDDQIKEARQNLQTFSTKLSIDANNLLSSLKGSTNEIKEAAEKFVEDFKIMSETALSFGSRFDEAGKEKLMIMIQDIGTSSTIALQAAKSLSSDKENVSYREQLFKSAKSINDSMNSILELCAASSVGHTECNRSLNIIKSASSKLEHTAPVDINTSFSYAECLMKLTATSKLAIATIGSLNTIARSGDMQKLATKVTEVANVMESINDISVKAAYLIGVSDPSTIPATSGPIDRAAINQSGIDIKGSCEKIIDPNNTQKEILAGAATIAKFTSALCTICKAAGQNTLISATSRQQFINSAKDLAGKTSALVSSIKQLALTPTEETRLNCKESFEPLIKCVDSLIAFSQSSEFCGTHAKIMQEGILLQKPILESQRKLLNCSENVVNVVKLLCADASDENLFLQLSSSVKMVTEALQVVAKTISKSCPGLKECEDSIAKVGTSVLAIDQAIMEANVNSLDPREEIEKSSLIDSVRALSSLVELIAKVSKAEPGQIGATLCELPGNFHQVIICSIAAASNSVDLNEQKKLLDGIKEVSDNILEFLYIVNGSLSSTSKENDNQQKIETGKNKIKNSLSKLSTILEGVSADASELGKVIDKIESISASVMATDQLPKLPYQHYALQIEIVGKQVVDTVGDILTKTKTTEQYKINGKKLVELIELLNKDVQFAKITVEDSTIKEGVVNSFTELCVTLIRMVEAMRLASGKSNADQNSRAKLSQAARDVSMTVSSMITSVKAGSKGLLVCQDAISSINDIISELEGIFIFAQAGQLDPLDPKDSFNKNKDGMMVAAKALTEQVKGFITAVTGSQEELATLSMASVNTLNTLTEEVKKGAIAISSADKNMQQHLLSSVKLVAESLQTLISTAINASGKGTEDPAITDFSNAVKCEFGCIAELVRVTKLLSDQSTRGIRALEVSVSEINAAMIELKSPSLAQGSSLPDEVATIAKHVATAAATIVTISSKEGMQDDLVASSNIIKKQILDLCRAGKAVCENAPEGNKSEMHSAVTKTCEATTSLLTLIKQSRETGDLISLKSQVLSSAKVVSLAVSEVVEVSSHLIPSGYIDMSDPNVIAERELLAAASSIEAAAKNLSKFKRAPKGKNVDDLNFEGQILEAAKAIGDLLKKLKN
ncbi:Talin-1 [Lobulomyces angularis]|nr:Talin-1 [Lobulomyces angularis]